jgi:hypothetical protein
MGKFFSRFKKDPVDASVSSLGNLANFYSLLIFLIAIPFVLIIALVWVTGILGFNTYIFAGFACLLGYIVWRLYRRWGIIKAKMAAQTGDFQDLMREATQSGKDVEISLMNGIFTLRYAGAHRLDQVTLPVGRPQPLALEAPAADPHAWLPPERLREELAEFIRLKDEGVISPEEFDRIKASLLQRMSA